MWEALLIEVIDETMIQKCLHLPTKIWTNLLMQSKCPQVFVAAQAEVADSVQDVEEEQVVMDQEGGASKEVNRMHKSVKFSPL